MLITEVFQWPTMFLYHFFFPPETDNSAKAVKETTLFFSDFSLIVTGDTSASGCDTQSPVTFSGINGATVLGNWRDNFKELKCQEGLCHCLEKLRLPVHIVLGFFPPPVFSWGGVFPWMWEETGESLIAWRAETPSRLVFIWLIHKYWLTGNSQQLRTALHARSCCLLPSAWHVQYFFLGFLEPANSLKNVSKLCFFSCLSTVSSVYTWGLFI